MDVLIVGSIAYDSLESPAGKSENELGGSASYGGFSAAFHSKMLGLSDIALVGVVGDDFSKNDLFFCFLVVNTTSFKLWPLIIFLAISFKLIFSFEK